MQPSAVQRSIRRCDLASLAQTVIGSASRRTASASAATVVRPRTDLNDAVVTSIARCAQFEAELRLTLHHARQHGHLEEERLRVAQDDLRLIRVCGEDLNDATLTGVEIGSIIDER